MAYPLINDPVVFARDGNNNLVIPLRKASGQEAILILVRSAVRLWRDEWFLDRDVGTPWIETEDGVVAERDAIFGQGYNPAKIARGIRQEVRPIAGVVDVVNFKTAFDGETRNLTVSFVVRTLFGDSDPIELQLRL